MTRASLLLALCLALPVRAEKLSPLLIGNPAEGQARLDLKALLAARPKPLFVVIDTPYEIWSGQGSYLHAAVYRPDFTPASGATVYLDDRPVGVTDEKGTVVFRNLPRPDDAGGQRTVRAVIRNANETAAGGASFESYARTPGFESSHLFVYTDRGVYNPGQPILVRALAWGLKGDFKPIADKPVELILHDASGRILAGARPQTDAYGTASLRIPLPEEMPEGVYTLSAQFEGGRAEQRLRVERFVAPAIEIVHTLRRYFTPAEPALRFEVTPRAVTGGLVKQGKLLAVAEAGGAEVWREERTLDGSEKYAFALEGPKLAALKERLRPEAYFRISLTATDASGRSDTLKRDLRYAVNPYAAVLEADKDEYARGEQAQVQVKLVDVEGVPARKKPVRLEVAGQKPLSRETDENGVALFRLTARGDAVDVQAFVADVSAPLGSLSLAVMERKPMNSKVEQPVVRERREVPIEVAIDPAWAPTEKYVHADVVDSSGALVSAFLIPIEQKNGRSVARGRFVAPAWGTMLLTLFCAAKTSHAEAANRTTVGLLTEGQQVSVHPDRALKISLSGLPRVAKPGEALTAKVSVLDARGRKADAALGASLVDAAVLSLLDPLETRPADRFYDPELKVLSTTGSKILTWPVVTRNWGVNRMDIALPPFGFDEPDPLQRAGGRHHHAKKSAPGDDYEDMDGVMGGAEGSVLGGVLGGTVGGGAGYGAGSVGSVGYGAAAPSPAPAMKPGSAAMGAKGKVSDDFDKLLGGEADKKVVVKAQKIEIMGNAAGSAERARREEAAPARQAPAPVITMRTRFPETSLWLPELRAPKGEVTLQVTVPDSITRQALTLVASDKAGGVGVLRADLPVRQDLFARSDLPAALTAGDEVEVRAAVQNLSDKPATATLSLRSASLTVLGAASQAVQVPAQSAVGASFRVRAERAGPAEYEVTAEGPGFRDTERRTLTVLPRGGMQASERRGELARGQEFTAEVEKREGEPLGASLSVAFPAGASLWAAFAAARPEAWLFWEEPGTRAQMAWQLRRAFEARGQLTAERRAALDEALEADALLLAALSPDGRYSYLRTGEFSPYLTAKALAGLTAVREAGLPVDPARLQASVVALLGSLGPSGLFEVDDLGFWEGTQQPRREALSAEIYRAICEARPGALPGDLGPRMADLRARMAELAEHSEDPLTAAQATLGLLACGGPQPLAEDRARAERVAARLLALRRTAHWEPSWFHAYGGTLEATAAAVELLARDPLAHAAELREAELYLLGARDGLGTWRNGSGTVASLRALAALPATRAGDEVRSTVRVAVNGAEVAQVAIDPRDPFGSGLALAHLDLAPHLKPGKNAVAVRYDGALRLPVLLEERRPAGAQAGPFRAERKLSRQEAAVGEAVEVTLTLSAAQRARLVAVEEPVPANAAVEPASLEALKASGAVSEYRSDGGLVLYLKALGPEPLVLHYRLVGARAGTARAGATVLRPVREPERAAAAGGETALTFK